MAFTGLAVYSQNIFDGIAEDVSEIVSMVSPFETPLLNAIGDAERSAQNVLFEWLEDSLNPNVIVNNGAVAVADTTITIAGGNAATISKDTILLAPNNSEYIQVTAIVGNDLTVTRGFGGTTAASFGDTQNIRVISEAAKDGADVDTDVSRARIRKFNFTQIFKKDIIISGTNRAVNNLGGISSEYDHQVVQRTREALRDLEKAFYLSILSGNTIGSATGSRTAQGLYSFLSTNAQSLATLTESWLGNVVKAAWDKGGTDLDIITADTGYKRIIDTFNSTRIRVTQDDPKFKNIISRYESSYGIQDILPPSRWMLPNTLMVLSSQRIKVVPLTGRTFQSVRVGTTGDADKGMVIGEYTFQIRNEEALARAFS